LSQYGVRFADRALHSVMRQNLDASRAALELELATGECLTLLAAPGEAETETEGEEGVLRFLGERPGVIAAPAFVPVPAPVRDGEFVVELDREEGALRFFDGGVEVLLLLLLLFLLLLLLLLLSLSAEI